MLQTRFMLILGILLIIGAEHIHDDIAAAVELHLSMHPVDAPDAKES